MCSIGDYTRSLSLDMLETVNSKALPLITSDQRRWTDSSNSTDLVRIKYARVQKTSPEFNTVYEGIDQSIDVGLSTFIFSASPEPVISLYDFVMTTFVPQKSESSPSTPLNQHAGSVEATPEVAAPVSDKIRLRLRLTSVQCKQTLLFP